MRCTHVPARTRWHSASSAIQKSFVETVFKLDVLAIFPPSGCLLRLAPSLHRVPRDRFPCFLGTMGSSDSRDILTSSFGPPSLLAYCAPYTLFAPAPMCTTISAGLGLVPVGPLPPPVSAQNASGLPSSWWVLSPPCPALRPRRAAGHSRSRILQCCLPLS